MSMTKKVHVCLKYCIRHIKVCLNETVFAIFSERFLFFLYPL